MRRRTLLLIAFIAVVSVAASCFLLLRFIGGSGNQQTYERSIVRSTHSMEEDIALNIAEESNCSKILGITRFDVAQSSQAWPYTWARFIDTEVIEYYDLRFKSLKGKANGIWFYYEANVSSCEQFRVVYFPPPPGGSIFDDALRVLDANGTLLLENEEYTGPVSQMLFAYRLDSEFQKVRAEEIDFSFTSGYVIEMRLEYTEYWGPVAAFDSIVYQIIVLDQDFVPVLFCIHSAEIIS